MKFKQALFCFVRTERIAKHLTCRSSAECQNNSYDNLIGYGNILLIFRNKRGLIIKK